MREYCTPRFDGLSKNDKGNSSMLTLDRTHQMPEIRTIAFDDPGVCQLLICSNLRHVQIRLNESTSCLKWRLVESLHAPRRREGVRFGLCYITFATFCHLLQTWVTLSCKHRLKCNKFDLGWASLRIPSLIWGKRKGKGGGNGKKVSQWSHVVPVQASLL